MENGNKYARLEAIIEETARLLKEAGKKNHLTALERDLILEKLREAYDRLFFGEWEKTGEVEVNGETARQITPEPGVQEPEPAEELPEIVPDETELTSAVYREENVAQDHASQHEEQAPVPEVSTSETEDRSKESRKKNPEILADRYSPPHAFRNEALGQGRQHKDLSSKIQNKPIEDIGKAIGINDKFHFIRELFGGDNTLYDKTIRVLNGSPDFNHAFDYLNQHFEWDMEDPSVKKLLELTRRKFIARENE